MSITRLRELKKKYEALVLKGDRDASRELADIRGLLRSKGAGVVVDEAVTPAQQRVFNRERQRMMTALNNPTKKLSPTEREAVLARGQRNAAAEVRKGAVSPTGERSPIHAQAKAHHEYARKESKKLDAIVKRKPVKEDALDEARMVGGADFIQGVKNLVTGKGFKTNREVVGDRVNANYAAMKKKKKGKTPVAEGMSPCEAAALKRLKSAEAADLKEYPGKKGEAAHKRLHKTIGSILKKK
jgi:hypothetical protein